MMRLTLILGALCALLAGGWYVTVLRGIVASLTVDLREARAAVIQRDEAAAVLDAHIRYQRDQAAKWEAVAKEFSTMEGADAPLSPYGRAVLDGVR